MLSKKHKPVTPLLTVDIVIAIDSMLVHNFFAIRKGGIVMIHRKNKPHGWALPGGFVDVGETVEHAAVREAKEETGLDVYDLQQIGCYSDPKRDPRGHTVSIAFAAKAKGWPVGADDAEAAEVFKPTELPKKVCFDHRKIVKDWLEIRKSWTNLI